MPMERKSPASGWADKTMEKVHSMIADKGEDKAAARIEGGRRHQ